MRKKEDVTAHLKEYEQEYEWLLSQWFGHDPETDLTELVNGFWHGPEVVMAMRQYAYDQQHKDDDNGNKSESKG
jgi:hypothetical protein